MDKDTVMLIFSIGLLLFMILVTVFSILSGRKNKSKTEDEENGRLEKIPAKTEFHATVTDMACTVKTIGHKMPTTIREFAILFRDDEEKIHNIPVPEEYYSAFEKQQSGILTLIDGEFFSFEIDD